MDRPVLEVLLGKLADPRRGDERLGLVVLPSGDEDRTAEGVAVGDRLRQRFAVSGLRLASDVKIRARLGPQAPVASAVGEELRADRVVFLHEIAEDAGRNDDSPSIGKTFGFRRHQVRIEKKGQVRLQDGLLVKEEVPLGVGAMRIAGGVFQLELLDEPRLAATGVLAVAVGADDVHLYLG